RDPGSAERCRPRVNAIPWRTTRRVASILVRLGAWRSLVARTVRVGEVPGSNPGAPISVLARGGSDGLDLLLPLDLDRLGAGAAVGRRVGDRDAELDLAGRVQRLLLLALGFDQELGQACAHRLADPRSGRRGLDAVPGGGQVTRVRQGQVEGRGALLLV